jgi:hypothetical protein
MRRIILVLAILLVAVVAYSAPRPGEYNFSATGGLNLSDGYYTGGPGAVDVLATDGTATVVFFWFEPADRTTVVRTCPYGDPGIGDGSESAYGLRSGIPRSFDTEYWGASDGPDSCYVTLGTATEVLMTW